jgi:hypothetical protein
MNPSSITSSTPRALDIANFGAPAMAGADLFSGGSPLAPRAGFISGGGTPPLPPGFGPWRPTPEPPASPPEAPPAESWSYWLTLLSGGGVGSLWGGWMGVQLASSHATPGMIVGMSANMAVIGCVGGLAVAVLGYAAYQFLWGGGSAVG